MSENQKETPDFLKASINIKMDMVRFKDDILKDIRSVQTSLDNKYLKADELLKERINHFELKINSFQQKISELSNLIITDKTIRENVVSLNQFKEEMKDAMFKRRAKFNDFETQVNNDISRINSYLSSTVIYPSLIGKTAKFKTFHEFMDYVVQEIAQLVIFKEKSGLDLTPFKRKIDTTLDEFKILMKNFNTKEVTNTLINQAEERMKSLIKIYDDRLQDARVENSHYAFGMQKKAEEMEKKLESLQKLEKKLKKISEKYQNDDFVNDFYNEISSIKHRINIINEILKELLSYHPASKKNFMKEFEKKPSKVYSGVKQYIKGNLNANELSSMKKFTYEKSNTKVFDKSIPYPSTSPFPSPDINNNNYISNGHSPNNDQYLINNYSNKNEKSVFDKRKTFLSQKSFNIAKKISDEPNDMNINNFEKKEKKSLNKNIFFRRKTFNYDNINSFESSKLNRESIKDMKERSSNKSLSIKDNKDINKDITDEKNLNNPAVDNNNVIISNIKKEEEKNKDKFDIIENNTPLIDNNNIKQSDDDNNSNHYIIKEEDENIMSDTSFKKIENKPKDKNISKNDTNIISENLDNKQKENKNKNDIDIIRENLDNKEIIKEEDNKDLYSIDYIDETIITNKNININNNIADLNNINKINNNNNSENKKIAKNILTKIASPIDNSENNTIQILTIKKKPNPNNKKENQNNFIENININKINSINSNITNSLKNISNNNTHSSKNSENNLITPRMHHNDKKDKKPNNNTSYPKSSKHPINNTFLAKNIIPQSPQNQNYISLDRSNYLRNKNQNNLLQNYSVFSINKANMTYSNFPKINQDLSKNKISQINNYFESKDNNNIIEKTLNVNKKYQNQGVTRVAAYVSKPKKVLLTNPDNIPPNGIIRKKNKSNNKNIYFLNQTPKGNKYKKTHNLYHGQNFQYYLP